MWSVLIDWTDDFERALQRLDERVDAGDQRASLMRELVDAQLAVLQRLDREPTDETMILRRVVQSRRYQIWRVSHEYIPDIAVRTIVWFTPQGRLVVALFFNDKAQMGDVFYDSVGTRSDLAIDHFIRQTGRPERESK